MKNLTAHDILAIEDGAPESLFSVGNYDSIEVEYKEYLKRWHPDVNGNPMASDVTQKIIRLRKAAVKKVTDGVWEYPNVLMLQTERGAVNFRYLKKTAAEIGEVYIGKKHVIFLVDATEKELIPRFTRNFPFKFADEEMKENMSRCLPTLYNKYGKIETHGKVGVVVNRPDGYILLKDLMDHVGGKMDYRHAAWMMSCLCNINCYLFWEHFVHGGISPYSCFVNPEKHSIALLGSWWYGERYQDQLRIVPNYSIALLPDVMKKRRADYVIDLELSKHIGRTLLGDYSGAKLYRDPDIPRSFINWVTSPSAGNALLDYEEWVRARDKMGPRKFTNMGITDRDVYKMEE